MIADIRYQLFFVDPQQEKTNQLSAVDPMFTTPAAIDAILKTVKFEGKLPLIVSGGRENLLRLLQKIERLDLTEWGDFDGRQRMAALKDLVPTFELNVDEDIGKGKSEEQVLGLEEIVASAKKTDYPPDLQEANRWIWDRVWDNYKEQILKGATEEEREAIHRIIYSNSARKRGVIPWAPTTHSQIQKLRKEVRSELIRGEDKGRKLIDKVLVHLQKEGMLKVKKGGVPHVTAQKYFGSDYSNSRYEFAHILEAKLSPGVATDKLYKAVLHTDAFQRKGKELQKTVDRTTNLDVDVDDGNVRFFIIHVLEPYQASLLTQKQGEQEILKEIDRICKLWYKTGEFPTLELEVK